MRELKSISPSAVGAALEKALRYRLLNEPLEAESICQDILRVDPDNQEALVTLILARSDLFDDEYVTALERAKSVLPLVPSHVVTGWYLHAMHCFERAEKLAPADNPDAILRWNTCARWLARHEEDSTAEQSLTRDLEAEFGEEAQTR
jgi:hypothetical protein